MGWSEAELSLTLMNDRAMAKLNRETFHRRGPTNVIAFPVDVVSDKLADADRRGMACHPPPKSKGPPPVLGEVVISVETTRRQADEFDWPFEELFDFYLIHGILHLVGYDHETPAEEAAMEAKAWELMEVVASDQLKQKGN